MKVRCGKEDCTFCKDGFCVAREIDLESVGDDGLIFCWTSKEVDGDELRALGNKGREESGRVA
jgi:hypothetical protein